VTQALIQLVAAPALVAAATLAARRWGQRAGGVVSAFPAIVGPVLLVAALAHGPAFTARAANGTLLGLAALAAFALAYARVAVRADAAVSFAAGWAAAAVAATAAGALGAGPPAGLAVAAVTLALARRAMPRDSAAAPTPAGHAGAWDLPLRMALTAVLVVTLTAGADRLGAAIGGVLAALPVLASILAAFAHLQHGGRAAAELLRGMLGGMAGFVAFCALVAALVQPAGIAGAFAAATAAALAVQLAQLRPMPRPASRSVSTLRSNAERSSADIAGSSVARTPSRPTTLGNATVTP
jgi:hypothetical protein